MKYDFECIPEPSGSGRKQYLIELPWPPTVNTYWRHAKGKTYLSTKGKSYRKSVEMAVLLAGGRRNLLGDLFISIIATPPDMKKRDLDNLLKAPLDALAKCGVYEDDSQICRLQIERTKPSKPGLLLIEIREV